MKLINVHLPLIRLWLCLVLSLSAHNGVAQSDKDRLYVGGMAGLLKPAMESTWSQANLTSDFNAALTQDYGLSLGVDRGKYRIDMTLRTANWGNASLNSVFVHYDRPYPLRRFMGMGETVFLSNIDLVTGLGLGYGQFSNDVTRSTTRGLGIALFAGLHKPINSQWQVFSQVSYHYLGFEAARTNTAGNQQTIALQGAVLFELGMRFYLTEPYSQPQSELKFSPKPEPELAIVKPVLLPSPLPVLPLVPEPEKTTPVLTVLSDVNVEQKSAPDSIDERLFFRPAVVEITPSMLVTLTDVLTRLQEDHSLRIEIQGHSHGTEKPIHNLILSQRRAQIVAQYLISRGINADRIETVGFGITRPIASNDTVQGRAQNRRVGFRVLPLKIIEE